MRITILEVGSPESKVSAKGTAYSQLPVKYEADGKNQSRKFMSFDKAAYAVLSKAVAGESYEVDLKKNGEYWDWVKVTKVDGEAAQAAKPSGSSGSKGGNWETPEERARRQVYIMRQNALTNAVAFCDNGATVNDVLRVAEQFAAWSANIDGDDDDEPSID